MFEIVIQIKEKDGKFRTIIDSPEKCNDAYLLLPSYVQKIFDAWKNDSPDTKEVCGEKLKSMLTVDWQNFRYIFHEIYWD